MGECEGEKASTQPSDHRPLFCPHCDYNLTGLPSDRCPECGRGFSPYQLIDNYDHLSRPIRIMEFLWRLLWLPGAYLATVVIADAAVGREMALLFAVVLGLMLLVLGFANSLELARRIAVTRAAQRDRFQLGVNDAAVVRTCAVLLYGLQLLLGFGVVAAWTWVMP